MTGAELSRVDRWFRSRKSCPDLNRPVYDRMAEVLCDGLSSIDGPARHAEQTAVLLRMLALVNVAALNGATEAQIQARCDLLSAGIHAEMDSLLRIARPAPRRRVNA